MRKALILIAAFVFISFSLYAEINLSGWGRFVITPISFSGDNSSVSAATYNSSDRPNIGFSISGISENEKFGFLVDTAWDGGTPRLHDNAKAWVKPFSIFKLTAGWFVEDDFRGKIGNTEFASWLLPNSGRAEDNIFSRFQATVGAHFTLTPIKGLSIEAAIGSTAGGSRANRNLFEVTASDVYKAIHVGVGYKIPDVGFVRTQFIGNNRKQLKPNLMNNATLNGQFLMEGLARNNDADIIEIAFQYTGLDGLDVDLGTKIPLKYTTDTEFTVYPALNPNVPVLSSDNEKKSVQKPFVIAVAATYTFPMLSSLNFMVRTDLSFGGFIEEENVFLLKNGLIINAWINPSYYVTEFFRVGIDMGFEFHGEDKWQQPIGKLNLDKTNGSEYFDFGVGPWIGLQVGGGTIKTGVMMMFPGNVRYVYKENNSVGYRFETTFSGEPVISIPICFTYSL
jgi:hypothetical protein